MEDLWFFLVALLFAVYIALDGFDFGVGILHLFVARTRAERSLVLRSIGPVWDGNEVWLVAAGATLLCAFPALFAAVFSGFYLPLMLVLWLLIFRALGVEMKHQSSHPMWLQFWDVAFSVSSLLLALCFGAGLGNLLRGLPLTADGSFFLPLWSSFRVDGEPGVLDWYTVLVGLHAVLALALHGAFWLVSRADGEVHARARKLVQRLLVGAVATGVSATIATFWVHPEAITRLVLSVPGIGLVALSGASLALAAWFHRRGRSSFAFWVYAGHLVWTILGAAYAIHPHGLPALRDSKGVALESLAASADTLRGTLVWWIPGMLIAIGYTVFAYRLTPKTFSADVDESH